MENHENCAVTKTIKVIGSKWTMLILHHLNDGTKRFGELQMELKGISPKTLSQRLQELEREKMVSKKVFAEVPLHVEYSLTDKGKSVGKIFTEMARFSSQSL